MCRLKIVEADLSMVPAIVELSMQLGYQQTAEEVLAQLEKIISRADHLFLTALLDNEVRGWAHFHQFDSITASSYIEVAGLVVDQACRRQGIGQALMAVGEEWAAKQGMKIIRVRSAIQREDAHTFYEHAGYTCIKQQKTFLKNLPAKP